MAKIHWSANVTAVFYYLWLVGPLIWLLTGFFIYKIKYNRWPSGHALDVMGNVMKFRYIEAEFYAIPAYQAGSLIFGIIYGLVSGSSKLGAWLYFGLSQVWMFAPYMLFLGTETDKFNTVAMPVLWFAMTLVLFSPLGNDVSSQLRTKIYLAVGTALVVGFHASVFRFYSINASMVILGALVAATVLIVLAFKNLEKEKTKKNEESSEAVYLVGSTMPATATYYGSAPQPASVIITA